MKSILSFVYPQLGHAARDLGLDAAWLANYPLEFRRAYYETDGHARVNSPAYFGKMGKIGKDSAYKPGLTFGSAGDAIQFIFGISKITFQDVSFSKENQTLKRQNNWETLEFKKCMSFELAVEKGLITWDEEENNYDEMPPELEPGEHWELMRKNMGKNIACWPYKAKSSGTFTSAPLGTSAPYWETENKIKTGNVLVPFSIYEKYIYEWDVYRNGRTIRNWCQYTIISNLSRDSKVAIIGDPYDLGKKELSFNGINYELQLWAVISDNHGNQESTFPEPPEELKDIIDRIE